MPHALSKATNLTMANGTAFIAIAGTAKCQSAQGVDAHVPLFPGYGLERWNADKVALSVKGARR
jgi:hypothetical protein